MPLLIFEQWLCGDLLSLITYFLSPRVGSLLCLLASDWPEPHNPRFWLAENLPAMCDSGQGHAPRYCLPLPPLSQPMRGQYAGHVTNIDQWEARTTHARKQCQVLRRWGLLDSERENVRSSLFLLWEDAFVFFRTFSRKFLLQTSFQ